MWPFNSNIPNIRVSRLTATLTTKIQRKNYVVDLQLSKHVITGQEDIRAQIDKQGAMVPTEVVVDIWDSELEAMRGILRDAIAKIDIRKALVTEIKDLANQFKQGSPKEPAQGLEGYLRAEGYQHACGKVVERLLSNQSPEQILRSLRNREDLPSNRTGAVERLLEGWENQGHERGCLDCIDVLSLFEDVKKS